MIGLKPALQLKIGENIQEIPRSYAQKCAHPVGLRRETNRCHMTGPFVAPHRDQHHHAQPGLPSGTESITISVGAPVRFGKSEPGVIWET